MSDEVVIVQRTQLIKVEPASGAVSVVNAGAVGPPGPEGPEGPQGIPGVDDYDELENTPELLEPETTGSIFRDSFVTGKDMAYRRGWAIHDTTAGFSGAGEVFAATPAVVPANLVTPDTSGGTFYTGIQVNAGGAIGQNTGAARDVTIRLRFYHTSTLLATVAFLFPAVAASATAKPFAINGVLFFRNIFGTDVMLGSLSCDLNGVGTVVAAPTHSADFNPANALTVKISKEGTHNDVSMSLHHVPISLIRIEDS